MSIKRMVNISWVFFLTVFLLLGYGLFSVWENASSRDAAQTARQKSFLLAGELQQSSENLTNYVRMYAVTGEETFATAYWDVVKVRSGDAPRPSGLLIASGQRVSLTRLMEEAGFTSDELGLLQQAGKLSDGLILLETEAMHAVKGEFRDDAGGFTKKGQPDTALAARLVFSKEYRDHVRKIMEPISVFRQRLTERLDNAVHAKTAGFEKSLWLLIGLSSVMTLAALGFLIFLNQTVVRPILQCDAFAQHVTQGNFESRMAYQSANEIGSLADSLRSMVKNLRERIAHAEEATNKAEAQSALAAEASRNAESARIAAEKAKSAGMHQAADQVTAIMRDVTVSCSALHTQVDNASKGALAQRQRAGETATAMEQMNATVLDASRNAGVAADFSEKARQQALSGADVVRDVLGAITAVRTSTDKLQQNLARLGERAEGIGEVLGIITDIADQTNLLALNAAIEAARAGEAGRGFAVVADEVRKLAEKTMQATHQVGEAVGAIQRDAASSIHDMGEAAGSVKRSTELAQTAGTSLQEIVAIVNETANQVRAIAAAVEEQSATSRAISRNTDEVLATAEATAGAMTHSVDALKRLTTLTRNMEKLVEDLRK